MALKFVAGSSGAGKSYQVYENMIRESMKHPEKQYLVIVPEQFTMQTQKEIVTMHPKGGLLNLDILSFNRLAYRVFEETGGNTLPVLEETGKSLVLQRVVTEHMEELRVLGRTLSRPASVSQMKSLVSELMQYQIRPENLDSWTESSSITGRLSLKIADIRTVYDAFHRYISEHYLTAEEVPQVMCDVIAQSSLVRGSVIVLDGFTGFTPVQNKVIRELLALAEDVTVVMTVDSPESLERSCREEQNLFHMTGEMFRRLTDMAKELHAPIAPVQWIMPGEKSRFSDNAELQILEERIFRSENIRRQKRSEKNQLRMGDPESGECLHTNTDAGMGELPPVDAGDVSVSQLHADAGKDAVRIKNAIAITECADVREECAHVVQQIRHMVRTQGYRYRDFAIVTGDLASYGRELSVNFEEEGIPYFLDEKKTVMTNPVVEFIRAAVDMNVQNYTYDSVFRFLRTGLTDFEPDEIDTLENYCRAMGIHGRSGYEEKWIRVPRNADPGMILYYNELREHFVELTADLHAGFHERMASGRRKSEVLYRFLIDQKIAGKIELYQEYFRSRGDAARAKEFEQIYGQVMQLFDKLVEVLGDEKLKMQDYQAILDAGFEEMKIGLIPPGEDQVMIGDIERTRLKKIRVLFLVGVNDGLIPKSVEDKGILSEFDRELLKANHVELAPSAREKMYQQRFYLYLNLTKPSDHLFLSYSLQSAKKEARMPSYLIGEVRKLFSDLEVTRTADRRSIHPKQTRTDNPGADAVHSETEAAEYAAARTANENNDDSAGGDYIYLETQAGRREAILAELQRLPEELSDEAAELLRHALDSDDAMSAAEGRRMLRAAAYAKQDAGIGADLARKLYGEELRVSVSELEQFAGCEFRHFLNYGLRLREREEYTFTPADFGTVMHAALENYAKLVRKKKMRWGEISAKDQHRLADEALELVYGSDSGQILLSTWRTRHQMERMREMLYRTVWAMDIQIEHGRFHPTDFEFRVSDSVKSMRFDLGANTRMQLQGKVDRLDECTVDGIHYVKIVDYKTGDKDMSLGQLYHGLQMQLMAYANAVIDTYEEENPEVVTEPAAVFYYHIDDPFSEKTADQAEQDILQALRPRGLVRSEKEILNLFDEELEESGKSDVIRVQLTKDGSLYSSSLPHVADAERFDIIRKFTDEKVFALGKAILQGNAEINPYTEGVGNRARGACTYCEYRGICAFDPKTEGYRYRRLEDLQPDEAVDAMRRAIQEFQTEQVERSE